MVGSALTAIGSLAGTAMNLAQQSQTNAMNRAMVHQQNRWNLDQWQRENAYNHPVNQVQRLRAAGINPGILYGSGGVTNTSAPSPDMQASRDVAPQISGLDLGNPLQDALLAAQIDNVRADSDKKRAETDTENQMRASRIANLDALTAQYTKQTESLDEGIRQMVKQGKLTDEMVSKIKFDRCMEGKRYMLDKKRLEMDGKMTEAQISHLNADIQRILAEKRVTDREYDEMVWTFAIRKAGLEAQVHLTEAQSAQANATAKKLGFEADMLEGGAMTEKGYAESLRGEHGTVNLIAATIRSGVQMVTRDFGNVFGIFK